MKPTRCAVSSIELKKCPSCGELRARAEAAEAKLTELHWGTPADKRRAEKAERDGKMMYEALLSIQNAYGDPHAEDDVTTTAREALAEVNPEPEPGTFDFAIPDDGEPP